MRETIRTETMLQYLQEVLDDFMKNKEKFGSDCDFVRYKMDMMIGAKEMVEALIGEPVNLQKDGKVTVGLW